MTQVDPRSLFEDDDDEVKNYDDLANQDAEPVMAMNPTEVELPGGILTEAGVQHTVRVRELTGYDEEKLARADIKKPIDYLNRLLMLGIEDIGGQKPNEMLINSMLIGDRDAIVLGIRKATFGNDIDMHELTCPECDKEFDLQAEVDEFEMKKLDDPVEDRVFEVDIKRGKAKVRLVTHGDVVKMLDRSSKAPEQNNVMLANCVLEINGRPLALELQPPEEIVRGFSMRDRQVLLDELSKRQPGPDMEVKIACPSCNYEETTSLDPLTLFRV